MFWCAFFPATSASLRGSINEAFNSTNATVYLVNTGWTGGAYGQGGQRFPIPVTRAVVRAILDGELRNADFSKMPGFNFLIPKTLGDLDTRLLNPRSSWRDQESYDQQARSLINKFQENFKRFEVSRVVEEAGPVSL